MNYTIEMEEGSVGSVIPAGLDYSYSDGRVKIVKNGETVLDKELIATPTHKYVFDINNDVVDVKPVEEYNVGNMLPQGMGNNGGVIHSEPPTVEEGIGIVPDMGYPSPLIEKASPINNAGYVKTMIDSFKKAMKAEWDKVPKNEKKLKELKTKLVNFCNNHNVDVPTEGVPSLVAASAREYIYDGEEVLEGLVCDVEFSEEDMDFICSEAVFQKKSNGTQIHTNKEVEIPPEVESLVEDIAMYQAKLTFAKKQAGFMRTNANVDKIKQIIVDLTKKERELTKGLNGKTKVAIKKYKKVTTEDAIKKLRNSNTKISYESYFSGDLDDVEETVENPPKDDTKPLQRQEKIDAKRDEIEELKKKFAKASPSERNSIKEKIKELNTDIYNINNASDSDEHTLNESGEEVVTEGAIEVIALVTGASFIILTAISIAKSKELMRKINVINKYYKKTDPKYVSIHDMKVESSKIKFDKDGSFIKGKKYKPSLFSKIFKRPDNFPGFNRHTLYKYGNRNIIELAYGTYKNKIGESNGSISGRVGVDTNLDASYHTSQSINTSTYDVKDFMIINLLDDSLKKYEDFYRAYVMVKGRVLDEEGVAERIIEDEYDKAMNAMRASGVMESSLFGYDYYNIVSALDNSVEQDEVVTESFLSKAKKYEKELEKISELKPGSDADSKEIDKFLNEHGDRVNKIAKILEKEPTEVKNNEIGACITYILGILGCGFSAAALSLVASAPLAYGAFVASVLAVVLGVVLFICNAIRATDNDKMSKDLIKIRNRLSEIKNRNRSKLSKENLKKLDHTLDILNDTISEYSSHVKVSESAITEAANIDSDIASIIAKFNRKGYKTKYSSAGHEHLRKKEDMHDPKPDGVYYGKLYTDARLMFDGDYKFPAAPKYWHWRKVDNCDYLDVTPIGYDKKDGTPDQAFAKWKSLYLKSLDEFADSLPERKGAKESDDDVKEESTLSIDNQYEMMMSSFEEVIR